MPLPPDLIDLDAALELAGDPQASDLLHEAITRGAIDSVRAEDRLLVRRSEVETWCRDRVRPARVWPADVTAKGLATAVAAAAGAGPGSGAAPAPRVPHLVR